MTGPNLEDLSERQTTFYGPIAAQPEFVKRADGRTPIAPEQWPHLPIVVVLKGTLGQPDQVQLAKEAFLYDAAENCYWCPRGQRLSYTGTTSEVLKATSRRVERQRYRAADSACESCPLRRQCLKGEGTSRTLSRDQYDAHRETLRERMLSATASAQRTRRQSEVERPFAVIKHQMGIRQFLLRGQANVTKEWRWMTSSANTQVLIRWWRQHRDRLPNPLLKMIRRAAARASPAVVGR